MPAVGLSVAARAGGICEAQTGRLREETQGRVPAIRGLGPGALMPATWLPGSLLGRIAHGIFHRRPIESRKGARVACRPTRGGRGSRSPPRPLAAPLRGRLPCFRHERRKDGRPAALGFVSIWREGPHAVERWGDSGGWVPTARGVLRRRGEKGRNGAGRGCPTRHLLRMQRLS